MCCAPAGRTLRVPSVGSIPCSTAAALVAGREPRARTPRTRRAASVRLRRGGTVAEPHPLEVCDCNVAGPSSARRAFASALEVDYASGLEIEVLLSSAYAGAGLLTHRARPRLRGPVVLAPQQHRVSASASRRARGQRLRVVSWLRDAQSARDLLLAALTVRFPFSVIGTGSRIALAAGPKLVDRQPLHRLDPRRARGSRCIAVDEGDPAGRAWGRPAPLDYLLRTRALTVRTGSSSTGAARYEHCAVAGRAGGRRRTRCVCNLNPSRLQGGSRPRSGRLRDVRRAGEPCTTWCPTPSTWDAPRRGRCREQRRSAS